MRRLRSREHDAACVGIIPERAVANAFGIPPGFPGGDARRNVEILEWPADLLATCRDEIWIVRAAEQLDLARRPTVDDRNAAPAPQTLVQIRELLVVGPVLGDEHKGLRDGSAAIAFRLEEARMRSVRARLLHGRNFFGRTCGTIIVLDEDEAVDVPGAIRLPEVDEPAARSGLRVAKEVQGHAPPGQCSAPLGIRRWKGAGKVTGRAASWRG